MTINPRSPEGLDILRYAENKRAGLTQVSLAEFSVIFAQYLDNVSQKKHEKSEDYSVETMALQSLGELFKKIEKGNKEIEELYKKIGFLLDEEDE